MYTFLLALHNVMRWIVLITAVIALYQAWTAWRGSASYNRRGGVFYTVAFDIQLLLGFLLFFIFSPATTHALQDIGAAMSNENARYFLAEHFPLMIIALIIAHIGAARSKKAANPAKTAFLFYTVSLFLILLAIPWPFLSYGRPLLPAF